MKLGSAAIVFLTTATPASSVLVRRADVPSHAKVLTRANDRERVTLQIGLALQNVNELEDRLRSVSTPGNPQYGKYLEADQVRAIFYPTSGASAAIKRWLQSAGVEDISEEPLQIRFSTTVQTANRLLNTTFHHYDVGGTRKLRTREYSVPDHIHQHVDLIHPTTYFGHARRSWLQFPTEESNHNQDAQDAASCNPLTPACILQKYNISYTPDPKSGSRVGFSTFLNASLDLADVRLYQSTFNFVGGPISVVSINKGLETVDPRPIDGEPYLDADVLSAVARSLPMTQFITGGAPPYIPDALVRINNNEPYLEYYQYLMDQPNAAIPQVIGNSYGEDERTVPEEYACRVCNFIGMMGLRGVSVLECSQDYGIGAACVTNDGKNTPEFDPQFPGTCPYVTSVGGTQGQSGSSNSGGLEPPVAWFGSSGGFSRYFRQAWYQKEAVEGYLRDHINPATKKYYSQYTDFGGRGFPDISAHSLYPL